MGNGFVVGAGTSTNGVCVLDGICLNLRCLLALDVMQVSCLPTGASQCTGAVGGLHPGKANARLPRVTLRPLLLQASFFCCLQPFLSNFIFYYFFFLIWSFAAGL